MAKKYRTKLHLHLKKGALHRQLKVPAGKKIPRSLLEKEKHSSNPKTRKRATFALNARSWHHGGHHRSSRPMESNRADRELESLRR